MDAETKRNLIYHKVTKTQSKDSPKPQAQRPYLYSEGKDNFPFFQGGGQSQHCAPLRFYIFDLIFFLFVFL